MTRPEYSKLDAAILDAVPIYGTKKLSQLLCGPVLREATKHEMRVRGHAAGRADDKPAWRFVEARLQSLRKEGYIKHISAKGWYRNHA